MMKRLRTASSPFLQPLDGSQPADEQSESEAEQEERISAFGLGKLKGNGDLLPLLPIPLKPVVSAATSPISCQKKSMTSSQRGISPRPQLHVARWQYNQQESANIFPSHSFQVC